MQVVLRQHAAQQYGLQGFHPRFRRAVFLGNFFQSVVHFIQRLTGVVLHLREDQLPIITAFHFQRTGQAARRDQLLHQFGTDVNGVLLLGDALQKRVGAADLDVALHLADVAGTIILQ